MQSQAPQNLNSMTEQFAYFIKSTASKIIFFLSIIVCIIWFLSKAINVYHFLLVGAIFEILWLPVIAMIFILPVLALLYWIKDKFNFRSLNLYSLLLLTITILVTVFYM